MTEQSEREKWMSKIRGMLALADPERGGTQSEIEAAAAMAKRLMDKYNISMLDVMNEEKMDPNLFVAKTSSFSVSKMKAWHWALARAIGRIFGTRYYSSGSWGKSERDKNNTHKGNYRIAHMTFFGIKTNVEVACEMFDKWAYRIDQMATVATSDYLEEMKEEFEEEMMLQHVKQVRHLQGLGDRSPQTWRTSWLDGCLAGIHTALTEEEEKREDADRMAQGKKPLSGLHYSERCDVLRREREEEERKKRAGVLASGPVVTSSSTALALYSEKVDKAYDEHSLTIGLRHVRSSASNKTNYSGFEQGHKVGKGIRLNSKEIGG
jgi:hypothetical protein